MCQLQRILEKEFEIMNKGDLYNILGNQIIYNHVEGFILIY
jgi:hypothetical protein